MSEGLAVRWMTTLEYATHRGISDSLVRRYKRQGRLVLSADGKLIDVARSDDMLGRTMDLTRGGDISRIAQEDPEPATPPPEAAEAQRPSAGKPKPAVPAPKPVQRAPDVPSAAAIPDVGDDLGEGEGSQDDAPRASGTGAAADLRLAMARERLANARIKEMQLAEEARQLVRADAVAAAIVTLARQSQQALMTLSSRVSHQVAAAGSAQEARKILDEEMRRVCETQQHAARRLILETLALPVSFDELAAYLDGERAKKGARNAA